MDNIWMICNLIVYGLEIIIFGLMIIGLYGMIGGEFENPLLQEIFDEIFNIDVDDEAL